MRLSETPVSFTIVWLGFAIVRAFPHWTWWPSTFKMGHNGGSSQRLTGLWFLLYSDSGGSNKDLVQWPSTVILSDTETELWVLPYYTEYSFTTRWARDEQPFGLNKWIFNSYPLKYSEEKFLIHLHAINGLFITEAHFHVWILHFKHFVNCIYYGVYIHIYRHVSVSILMHLCWLLCTDVLYAVLRLFTVSLFSEYICLSISSDLKGWSFSD